MADAFFCGSGKCMTTPNTIRRRVFMSALHEDVCKTSLEAVVGSLWVVIGLGFCEA